MPRHKTDLSDQIEAILREAIGRIVALVDGERALMLESVQQAVTALDSTLKDRPGLPEARRAAAPASTPPPAPTKRPPRDQWVRTADVVIRLRELLAGHHDGAHIAELREETRFSDMQLHRALRQLRDAGEVSKEGELRRTVYHYIGQKQAAPSRKRPSVESETAPTKRASHPRKAKSGAKTTTTARRGTPEKRSRPRPPTRPPRSQWVSTDDVMRATRKALRRKSKGLRMSDLCTATGYSDKQLYRALVALVEEGTVHRVGKLRNMRYVLA